MKKLAIISTHPIQYNAPLFKLLAERDNIGIKVFYTWSQSVQNVDDKGFGQSIQWDIPLLEGYEYEIVKNTSKRPENKSFWSIQTPSLIPQIKKFSPDAILVYGWNFKSHFKTMRHFKNKIPVWFRGDSTLLDYNIQSFKHLFKSTHQHINISTIKQLIKFKLRQTFLSYIYKHIDTAFYVGTNNKAYFKKLGLKEHQLIFAPHAIDNKRFEDDPDKNYENKALEWRKELGIPEKDIVFLFAGKFEPKKNPILLLNAFIQLLIDKHKTFNPKLKTSNQQPATGSFHLLLVGSGPLEPQLKKLASGYQNIHFLPFHNQSKMPVIYRLGDVLVLPSQGPGETWGLAVNEAFACSRPAIVSNKVGCAIDLVEHKKDGWAFQSGNTNELLKIMDETTKSQELLKKMGQNAIHTIKTWDYESIAFSLENTLNSISNKTYA